MPDFPEVPHNKEAELTAQFRETCQLSNEVKERMGLNLPIARCSNLMPPETVTIEDLKTQAAGLKKIIGNLDKNFPNPQLRLSPPRAE